MKSLKGSQTEKNLLIAFAGESQARNRYTYFASHAKKQGFIQISKVFEETAEHEKEHAKRFFKFLQGGALQITETFPAGQISTVEENLIAAMEGEKYENTIMYPQFAQIAKEEGFNEISEVFINVAKAEKYHEQRYKYFIEQLKHHSVFKKEYKTQWKCLNCGYIHEDNAAPDRCPACAHAQGYFEEYKGNW